MTIEEEWMKRNGLKYNDSGISIIDKKPVSIIRWQKGKPKERGSYIVSLKNGKVDFDNYDGIVEDYLLWFEHEQEEVVAWCPLSDIKPYKEGKV